jgi:transposase
MGREPPIPKELWDTIPAAAQAALLAVFEELYQRVARLEKTVAELQARLGQNSSNSSRPPSSDPPQRKRKPPTPPSGRKRGGQPGHPRHERPLVTPDQVTGTIECKPAACRHCGEKLSGTDPEPSRHQVAELPPIAPHVTEYRLHQLTCAACGQRTRAAVPPQVPTGAFGPRLTAVLALLAGAYRLGKRPIRQLCADLFGLSISLGMICKLQKQVAGTLETPVAELCAYVRHQSANVDETGWREANRRAWLWTAVTRLATVFVIAKSRSADVVRNLLGSDYRKVVSCDRWKAYRGCRLVQWCWAHLRRDFQAMIDRRGKGREIGEALLAHSDQMFAWWHRVRDGTLCRATFQKYMGWLRACFREDLERGVACGCAKTEGTCRDLLAHEPWLWTFLWHEEVDPTNNAAERAVRHAVLWRKSSGGTASCDGSRFVERVLSVVATCRQQSRGVLDYLTACCHAHTHHQSIPSLLPSKQATLLAA